MKPTHLTWIATCVALAAGLGAAPSFAADVPAGEPMKDMAAPGASRPVPADAPAAPMSAEEKRKAREEARREAQQKLAAERAAAEKARLEEEIRLCVIKPVMTDAEIDACRKAGKRRI